MARIEKEIMTQLAGIESPTDEQISKEDGRNVTMWILDMSVGKRKRKKLAKWLWNEANTAEKMLTYRLLGKADYNAIIQA